MSCSPPKARRCCTCRAPFCECRAPFCPFRSARSQASHLRRSAAAAATVRQAPPVRAECWPTSTPRRCERRLPGRWLPLPGATANHAVFLSRGSRVNCRGQIRAAQSSPLLGLCVRSCFTHFDGAGAAGACSGLVREASLLPFHCELPPTRDDVVFRLVDGTTMAVRAAAGA